MSKQKSFVKRFEEVELPEYGRSTVRAVCNTGNVQATFPVMRHVDFSNAVADRTTSQPFCWYRNVTFYKCDFTNADIQQLTFEDCNFIECVFEGTTFRQTDFVRAKFLTLNFAACRLYDVSFYTCLFAGVKFFDDTEISYLKSLSTIFTNSLIDCKFTKCDRFFEKFNLADNQLIDCELDEEKFRLMGNHVPSDGAFIGWKCGDYFAEGGGNPLALECLIKLLIPEDAKRVGAATKCRASKVKVLEITSFGTGEKLDFAFAPMYDFRYDVGKEYECPNFDDYAWNICAPGFHFFLDKKDAIAYMKRWN